MTDPTPENPPTQLPVSIDEPAASPSADVPAQRSGLPRWAWALLIAGGLLTTGVATTFFVIASLVFGASSAADCDIEGCSSGDAAISKGNSTQPSTLLDDDIERIPLDVLAVFDGQPVWATQLAPSWRTVTFDDNGVNVFYNDETGCALITSQTVSSQMADSPTDSIPSEEMVNGTIEAFAAKDSETSVLDLGTIDVTLAASRAETTIEFARGTLMSTSPAGVPQSIEVIGRSMPDSRTTLVATMTCDSEVHAAADEPYGQLLAMLIVVMKP